MERVQLFLSFVCLSFCFKTSAICFRPYFVGHEKQPQIIDQFSRTLPETNIPPENRPSQQEIHLPTFPTIDFQGRIVSCREGIHLKNL